MLALFVYKRTKNQTVLKDLKVWHSGKKYCSFPTTVTVKNIFQNNNKANGFIGFDIIRNGQMIKKSCIIFAWNDQLNKIRLYSGEAYQPVKEVSFKT